jgi:hypothetical protein
LSERLVTIARFSDFIAADLARQTLKDFDIEAVMIGQNTANLGILPTIQTIELQVMESQAQEAIEILESENTGE